MTGQSLQLRECCALTGNVCPTGQLAVLRENDSEADEPSCDWPLAQQILAELQEISPESGYDAAHEDTQTLFEPVKERHGGFWSSNGLKGWLDYHLGDVQDERAARSQGPLIRHGAQALQRLAVWLGACWHELQNAVPGIAVTLRNQK